MENNFVDVLPESFVKPTKQKNWIASVCSYFRDFLDTDLTASDYILSYRVLECGVVYNEYDGKRDDKEGDKPWDGGIQLGRPSDMSKIERSARTRLHLRLTNSKTSEIIAAGIVENDLKIASDWGVVSK